MPSLVLAIYRICSACSSRTAGTVFTCYLTARKVPDYGDQPRAVVSIWSYRSDFVTRTRVCSPRRLIVCCCDHRIHRDERERVCKRVETRIWQMEKCHYEGGIRTIVEVQDAVYISEVPMYKQADQLSIPSHTVVGKKCVSPFSVRFPPDTVQLGIP
jgi:hypothetical protein